MNFDIRLPIGLLFLALGLLVGGYGAAAPGRALSLGLNVDLAWGGVLLLFGAAMTALALRSRRRGGRA